MAMEHQRLGPQEVLRARDLARRGISAWQEAHGTRARLARVRRGGYVAAARWSELLDEDRYRGLVLSTYAHMRCDPPLMACRHSAAVLLELPTLGGWPDRVEVLAEAAAAGSNGLIRRHRVDDRPEPVTCHGIPVTPVPRTVVDLARIGTLAQGLVIADAALHWDRCSQADLDAEVDRIPRGGRGRRRAALAIHLADGRSESPGESLSRARMYELSLPQPDLQVRLEDRIGVFGWADFGWPGLIGEFDGKVKYVARETVWDEKQREDRARRTGVGVERWGWQEALRTEPLRRILCAAGLRPADAQEWRRWDPIRQPRRPRFGE
ncbi:hypothetical protein [Flexivirga sp. B27]